MTIQGVLLDIDGTLVLSNDIHAKAWVEAFAAFGYHVEFDQVRPLIGMGADQVVPIVQPELSGETGEGKKISDRRKSLIIEKFKPELKPTNGARELVAKMQADGLQIVVASSATSEELSILLAAAQVDDLLSDAPTTTSDDADASKPAPDLIEAALSTGKLQPDQVVMIGDTPYDIEAAAKANVRVIAVRCGDFSDQDLKDAIAIYNDPADLVAHYADSPLGKKTLH